MVVLVLAVLAAPLVVAAPASARTKAPAPKLGRTFVVSLVSGTVTVKKPGSARASRLTRRRRTIPVGSTVNATKGKVRLMGAVKRSGGTQAGVFYSGAFKASQARRDRAVIDLKLVGGDFSGCEAATVANGYASANERVRRLYGNAKGRFRTRGGHSAATVRGTKWLTEDTCDSTRVVSGEGAVSVVTEGVEKTIQDGMVIESMLVRFPPPVPEFEGFYAGWVNYELPRGGKRVGEDGPLGFVGFRFAVNLHKEDHPPTGDVCITRVDRGVERCTAYAFETNRHDTDCTDPGQVDCLYEAGDQCDPESGPGDYVVRFRVRGIYLPLTFTVRAAQPDPYWLEVYQLPGRWCLNRKEQSAFP